MRSRAAEIPATARGVGEEGARFFSDSLPVKMSKVLDTLIKHEFSRGDQLEAALLWIQDGGRKPRSNVMRTVGIVMELKQSTE